MPAWREQNPTPVGSEGWMVRRRRNNVFQRSLYGYPPPFSPRHQEGALFCLTPPSLPPLPMSWTARVSPVATVIREAAISNPHIEARME